MPLVLRRRKAPGALAALHSSPGMRMKFVVSREKECGSLSGVLQTRSFYSFVGTTVQDNVYFTFVKEKMKNLVIHPVKDYGWNQKGETVDLLPAKKNQRLKEVVESLPPRVEGGVYAHYLRYAGHLKNLTEAKKLHQHILESGRYREQHLGHLIVKMYLDCGSLEDAKKAFCRMERLDSVIWRDMLMVCAQQGNVREVFRVQRAMHQAGIIFEKRVFLTVLYVCAKLEDLEFGKQIHMDAVYRGVHEDILVRNALISVYARCGRLDIAQLIFDSIEWKNVPSYNAMIGGYVRHGYNEEVFDLFYEMNVEGYIASNATYSAVLSACVSPAYLKEGMLIHDTCETAGVETKLLPAGALIRMYGLCGLLSDAQAVFDAMTEERDVVVWTNMIEVYVNRGLSLQAFIVHEAMQLQRVKSNKTTFITLLNACNNPEWLEKGRLLHSHVLREGWEGDIKVAIALVRMYSSCGSLQDARRVFRKLHQGHVLVWNAIIQVHLDFLYSREAVSFVWKMQHEGFKGDNVTFAACFWACDQLKALDEGLKLHSAIQGSELEVDILVGSSLLKFYSSFGRLDDMKMVFNRMNQGKVMAWNSVITATCETGFTAQAIEWFQKMQLAGAPPDARTFTTILAAVTTLEHAKLIHRCIIESGYDTCLWVGNALLEMFGKLKVLKLASKTFEGMHTIDVSSWTSIIKAYARSGFQKDAVTMFRDMLLEGVCPSKRCFSTVLDVLAGLEAVAEGEQFHSWASEGGVGSDPMVGAALINMYSKFGSLEQSQECFDNILRRDVGCWNALLKAYIQDERHEEALELFQEMQLEPDSGTISIITEAATALEDLEAAKQIYHRAAQLKLDSNASVGTALLKMYSKLGEVESSRQVFAGVTEQLNAGAWNTLASLFARNSSGREAVKTFRQMLQEGVKPDVSSFTIFLSACTRDRGLVRQGRQCFASMRDDYVIMPTNQHKQLLINLLSEEDDDEV